ncbi:MAG: helix-turn-helix transcriptional regulator, partial [Phycisphaeraceae bacterium]
PPVPGSNAPGSNAPGSLPGSLIWAMPLMHNAQLLGGIVAEIAESRSASVNVRQAAAALREMIEQRNWTNAALLAAHRSQSQIEQHRAEAIHELKTEERYDFHRIYRLEEPALLGAIRRGDRREARAVLNRLLVGMIHAAGARLNLAKSFFLELVVTMTRTAVEAGGEPQELLGSNFASLTELAKIDSDEELATWLHRSLESVLAGLHLRRESTDQVLLSNALQFMRKHFTEDVSRDDAAEVACMSPSHFSRLFHRHFGRSFSDLLNQLRVDQAAELLVRTDRSLAVIALECGFADQSYFTKVFRKYRGETPADYRKRHGNEL